MSRRVAETRGKSPPVYCISPQIMAAIGCDTPQNTQPTCVSGLFGRYRNPSHPDTAWGRVLQTVCLHVFPMMVRGVRDPVGLRTTAGQLESQHRAGCLGGGWIFFPAGMYMWLDKRSIRLPHVHVCGRCQSYFTYLAWRREPGRRTAMMSISPI